MTFQLTEKGLRNHDKVLEYFFAYINAVYNMMMRYSMLWCTVV